MLSVLIILTRVHEDVFYAVFVVFSISTDSGATVITAISVLKEHGVNELNIVLVTLFSTPQGAKRCLREYPHITLMTSELHEQCPSHFGLKFFGTDV